MQIVAVQSEQLSLEAHECQKQLLNCAMMIHNMHALFFHLEYLQ